MLGAHTNTHWLGACMRGMRGGISSSSSGAIRVGSLSLWTVGAGLWVSLCRRSLSACLLVRVIHYVMLTFYLSGCTRTICARASHFGTVRVCDHMCAPCTHAHILCYIVMCQQRKKPAHRAIRIRKEMRASVMCTCVHRRRVLCNPYEASLKSIKEYTPERNGH